MLMEQRNGLHLRQQSEVTRLGNTCKHGTTGLKAVEDHQKPVSA